MRVVDERKLLNRELWNPKLWQVLNYDESFLPEKNRPIPDGGHFPSL